jgi:hypothetical protein
MPDLPPPLIPSPDTRGEEENDPRRRLCHPLQAPVRRRVAMLADAPAHHDEIVGHMRLRLMELSQTEREVLSGINDRLPASAHVSPFAMLPPAVWESPFAAFMLAWGLATVHPYLNLYLPRSDAGNAVLYLPAAPPAYPDSYAEGAMRELRRIHHRYAETRGPAPDHRRDSESTLRDWLAGEEQARLEAAEEILMLAEFLVRRLFGNEIVERHEGLFGAVMKRAMGFPAGLLLERV